MTLSVGALRRFAARSAPRQGERCEMCATPIGEDHAHTVNVETRRLSCTCRPCYLLFLRPGSAGGKIRAVPDRYRRLDGFVLDWDRLEIPVRTAFFFRNSRLDKFVAFYPSPAGATESLLRLEAWSDVEAANPVLAELEPDVEALLAHGDDAYLVPINACYELVGHVRKSWRPMDGGADARAAVDGFFAALRARCEGA